MAELTKVCVNGHEKVGDNLYVNSRGVQECNTCRQASRERYAKRKAEGRERELPEFCGKGHRYKSDVTPRVCEVCVQKNQENYRRRNGAVAKGTAAKCREGHEYTEQNTYRTSKGTRRCRECLRLKDRSRYITRRARAKEYSLEWQRANKHKVAAHKSTRRLKEADLGKVPVKLWESLAESFNGWCPYCRTPNHSLTLDHIIPISKGGTNCIDNLMPACKSCNSSKGNKNLPDWLSIRAGEDVSGRIATI